MDPAVLREIAADHLALAVAHHLAVGVIGALFWIRRRSMERVVDVYLAVAFATVAYATWRVAATLPWAIVAVAIALLWLRDARRPRNTFDFRLTPRPRLVIMGAAALFALLYPGYSPGLPAFAVSPLGVILAPTLVLALALLNSASPATDRGLHWTLAAAGGAAALTGLLVEGPIHLPLLLVAAYAVRLLLGKGKEREHGDSSSPSVRQIRDRMYSRKTLLPGPREARPRRFRIRRGGR